MVPPPTLALRLAVTGQAETSVWSQLTGPGKSEEVPPADVEAGEEGWGA